MGKEGEKQKKAAGSFRSRGRHDGPGRKSAAGGGGGGGRNRRKQQEALEIGVVKKALVERDLRGVDGCSQRRRKGGREEGRKEGVDSKGNLRTPL